MDIIPPDLAAVAFSNLELLIVILDPDAALIKHPVSQV